MDEQFSAKRCSLNVHACSGLPRPDVTFISVSVQQYMAGLSFRFSAWFLDFSMPRFEQALGYCETDMLFEEKRTTTRATPAVQHSGSVTRQGFWYPDSSSTWESQHETDTGFTCRLHTQPPSTLLVCLFSTRSPTTTHHPTQHDTKMTKTTKI